MEANLPDITLAVGTTTTHPISTDVLMVSFQFCHSKGVTFRLEFLNEHMIVDCRQAYRLRSKP